MSRLLESKHKEDVIMLLERTITCHEEKTFERFMDYDPDSEWTDGNGNARKGVFVFTFTDADQNTSRHFYTADYLIREYGC